MKWMLELLRAWFNPGKGPKASVEKPYDSKVLKQLPEHEELGEDYEDGRPPN